MSMRDSAGTQKEEPYQATSSLLSGPCLEDSSSISSYVTGWQFSWRPAMKNLWTQLKTWSKGTSFHSFLQGQRFGYNFLQPLQIPTTKKYHGDLLLPKLMMNIITWLPKWFLQECMLTWEYCHGLGQRNSNTGTGPLKLSLELFHLEDIYQTRNGHWKKYCKAKLSLLKSFHNFLLLEIWS